MSKNRPRVAPVLGAQDVSQAVQWYCQKLGFRCPSGVYQGMDDQPVYAVLKRDEIDIHIQIRRRQPQPDSRQSIETDAYFYISEAETLFNHCKAQGVNIIRPLQASDYGLIDFMIEDPAGNRLVFGSENPDLTI
ncbi:MAG: VOC family protein [Pseudomonadota bacterium]|nr:VOC family protein [Pseudomonadota bacterium]MEC8821406.1 VOC family protein [Pseudomonadota bacterium]